jgi:hypothetical protein
MPAHAHAHARAHTHVLGVHRPLRQRVAQPLKEAQARGVRRRAGRRAVAERRERLLAWRRRRRAQQQRDGGWCRVHVGSRAMRRGGLALSGRV